MGRRHGCVGREKATRLMPNSKPSSGPPGHGLELVELGFKMILEGLGVDITHPHLLDTPARAARAWYNELCKGLTTPPPSITAFPSHVDAMVILQHIPIRSLCAHHLLPFVGEATIAYIPGNGELVGISKLSRIADYWARRLQVQEDLTDQIADHLEDLVMSDRERDIAEGKCGGVGIIIRARHMCMELRGVEHIGKLTTSALRGVFRDGDARDEFFRLAGDNNT